jgi:hypothetical protein
MLNKTSSPVSMAARTVCFGAQGDADPDIAVRNF